MLGGREGPKSSNNTLMRCILIKESHYRLIKAIVAFFLRLFDRKLTKPLLLIMWRNFLQNTFQYLNSTWEIIIAILF